MALWETECTVHGRRPNGRTWASVTGRLYVCEAHRDSALHPSTIKDEADKMFEAGKAQGISVVPSTLTFRLRPYIYG